MTNYAYLTNWMAKCRNIGVLENALLAGIKQGFLNKMSLAFLGWKVLWKSIGFPMCMMGNMDNDFWK
jgi:hypothetical protein